MTKTRKGWTSEVPWQPRTQDVVPWPKQEAVALCAKPGCTWEAHAGEWCGFHVPSEEAAK